MSEKKKVKSASSQKNAMKKEAGKIFDMIVKNLDDHRANYDIPNYLVEYIAIRSLCTQYEDYIDDLKDLGPTSVGVDLDVMYE